MSTIIDSARRAAIERYDIVDAPPERDLDALTQLAAMLCDVSSAVVNIIDERFQYQVAAFGISPAVCDREDSMCAVILGRSERVVVPDASVDDLFADNPFVTGRLASVRLYASSPLITPEGVTIGTLCVFDERPGTLDDRQGHALDLLAAQVIDVLELRRVSRELAHSNRDLATFAERVSHDLRNPLAALDGFLELAAEDPELEAAPFAADTIGRARTAASRMMTMIGDLLGYARVDGARPPRVETDLASVVAAAIDDVAAAASASGARIESDAAATVTGDPTLLTVLVQNLLANALKFTRLAGTVPHLRVTTTRDGATVVLRVDDNGPGVPVAERERVFGLLERGSTADATGLGLGLATCRRIVDLHGGTIAIADSPLGGARIEVRLPAASVDA